MYKKISLSELRCHFTVKLIFPCTDLALWLFLSRSVTGDCSRHLFYALKILQKFISLLILILLLDALADPSLADSSGGSFWGHSTDLPTHFLWHQFSFKCELFCTAHSLTQRACSVVALSLLEEQQELILKLRAEWKGWWRLHLCVWKSCSWSPSPVREICTEMTFALHSNMAERCHPTVNCWSWFDLKSAEP